MQTLIDLFRFLAFGQIILLVFLFLKVPQKRPYIWATIFLGSCVSAYLLAYWEPIANIRALFLGLLPFSIALPLSFWLFSKTIFDDAFQWKTSYLIGAFLVIMVHTALFLLNGYVWIDLEGDWKILAFLPPYLLSLLFVFLGLLEAIKNYQADLVLNRLRFRYPFILLSAMVMFMSITSLMTLQHDNLPAAIELGQKILIALLVFYLSLNQLQLSSDFFQEDLPVPSDPHAKKVDGKLLSLLEAQIEENKIYQTESLTIRQLAEVMAVKEYKLRQLINQHLGFKNFNEFINTYRIKEACSLLLDQEKKYNITEIAFALGYSSLSPFNKAFKQITGYTPSSYRKSKLSQMPEKTD